MTTDKKRSWRSGGLLASSAIVGVALWWGLALPMTTRQGINYHVSTYQIPAYAKGAAFLHRHYETKALARGITRGLATDRERVEAIYQWTIANIRPIPKGFPIVDDHVWHIIIRGYGGADQTADVFTTLCAYAGLRAFWHPVSIQDHPAWLFPSFVRVDGRWVLFDIDNKKVFTEAAGEFLDVEELLSDPKAMAAAGRTRNGVKYRLYLERLKPFHEPYPLRAEMQMPGPRICFELWRRLGHPPQPGPGAEQP